MPTRMQYLKLHTLVDSLWPVLNLFTVTNLNEIETTFYENKKTRLIKELLLQTMRQSKFSNLFNFVRNLIKT